MYSSHCISILNALRAVWLYVVYSNHVPLNSGPELINSPLHLLTQQGEQACNQVTSAEDEIKQKRNGYAGGEDALSSP